MLGIFRTLPDEPDAITPFNDALEDYIKFCVANEEKGAGDAEVIKAYQDILKSYDQEKMVIEKLCEETCGEMNLTSDRIDEKIQQLFQLKRYGDVIKHHMDLEAHGMLNTKIGLKLKSTRKKLLV